MVKTTEVGCGVAGWLLAGLFNILGWTPPLGVTRGIDLLADAAIPLVLLVPGMQLQRAGLPVPHRVNWL